MQIRLFLLLIISSLLLPKDLSASTNPKPIFLNTNIKLPNLRSLRRDGLRNIPKIRVKIASGLKKVNLEALNLKRRLHLSSEVRKFDGQKRIKFNCYGKRSNSSKPILFASLTSDIDTLRLLGKEYNGRIDILTSHKGDACDVVNVTSLEEYLESLLSKEMSSSWPKEALKAQAVAARTYALHKMHSKQVSKGLGKEAYYDLESSEKHQVSGSLLDVTQKTRVATLETKGEVLSTKSGDLVPIFFHAMCGGRTFLPDHVWENHVGGYAARKCPNCEKSKNKKFSKVIKLERLKGFFKWLKKNNYISFNLDKLGNDFFFAPDSQSQERIKIYFKDSIAVVSKPLFRRYFGRFLFPSNNFKLKLLRPLKEIHVSGKGNGHGVGMCQMGALKLAQDGKSYKEILAHYFPNHKLVRAY